MMERDPNAAIRESANGEADEHPNSPVRTVNQAFEDCLAIGVGNPEGSGWEDWKFGALQKIQPPTVQALKSGRNRFTRTRAISTFDTFTAWPLDIQKRLSPTEFNALTKFRDALAKANPDWDLLIIDEILEAVRPEVELKGATVLRQPARSDEQGRDWPGPITLIMAPFALFFAIVADEAIQAWATAFGILLCTFIWIYEASLTTPRRRRRLAAYFRGEAYVAGYRRGLIRIIQRFDAVCSSQQVRRAFPPTSAFRSWTLGLYSRCLIIAVLYPLPFMLAQWAFWGEDVVLGSRVLLTVENTSLFGRALASASYVASLICLGAPALGAFGRRGYWLAGAAASAMVGFYLLGVVLGPAGPIDPLTVHFKTAIAFSCSIIAVALVLAFRSMDVSIAFVLAMTLAGLVGAIVDEPFEKAAAAIAPLLGISEAITDELIDQVVQWSITILLSWRLITLARKGLGGFEATVPATYILMVAAAIVSIGFGAGYVGDPIFYILMGLIPIANSVFDFASAGLTRWALRRGVEDIGLRTIAYGVFDFASALMIFLALGCALILTFHFANSMSMNFGEDPTRVIMNLDSTSPGNLVAHVYANPSGHFWLFLVYATTLLPTVTHLAIAVWALGPALMSDRRRRRFASRIKDPSKVSFDLLPEIASLAIWSASAAMIPIAGIALIWSQLLDGAISARLLIDVFAWFNVLIA